MTTAESDTTASTTGEPGQGRRYGILVICCLSLFIVGIDVNGLNVALPSIRADLGSSPSGLQWVLDAYTLVIASLLMLSGSVADRVGRRRIFQIGLVLFGAGSLMCSLAPSTGTLIAARMIQAVGGSMLNPVAMSIITNTFTEPAARARAIGVWGSTIGLSMVCGPVVGGALVDAFSWRAIFWLNVPIAAAAVVLTALFVPESKAAVARKLDPLAQVLLFVLLTGLTFAIIEGRSLGWTSPVIIGCATAAAASGLVLIWHERRTDHPLLDPRFFHSVPFVGAIVSAVLGFAAMGGFLYLNTLYLQEALGLSPLQAGLMTLPMAAATAVCSPLSGRMIGGRGPRVPMLIAGVGIGVSGIMLLHIGNDTQYWYLGLSYLVFGVGFGMLNSPITNAAVSGMPRSQAGVAAAIASTSRQVGSALGVALWGALVFSGLHSSMQSGFGVATHVGWALTIVVGAALVVIGFVSTGAWAARTRNRVAGLIDRPEAGPRPHVPVGTASAATAGPRGA